MKMGNSESADYRLAEYNALLAEQAAEEAAFRAQYGPDAVFIFSQEAELMLLAADLGFITLSLADRERFMAAKHAHEILHLQMDKHMQQGRPEEAQRIRDNYPAQHQALQQHLVRNVFNGRR